MDRNPSGSSSGSGVAVSANLCAAAIGTETDGSIVSPSSANGIVGLKPTLGLISRAGIIPIAQSQDTAGPMARTVTDAATLLGALTGVDDRDAATEASVGKSHRDYLQFLDPKGLEGARIGIARKFFRFHDRVERMMAFALETMKRRGAVLIDPADLPTHGKPATRALPFRPDSCSVCRSGFPFSGGPTANPCCSGWPLPSNRPLTRGSLRSSWRAWGDGAGVSLEK